MTSTDPNQPGPYDIRIDRWDVENAAFWLARITDWLQAGGPDLGERFTSFLGITNDDMAIEEVLGHTTTTLDQILATTTHHHQGQTP